MKKKEEVIQSASATRSLFFFLNPLGCLARCNPNHTLAACFLWPTQHPATGAYGPSCRCDPLFPALSLSLSLSLFSRQNWVHVVHLSSFFPLFFLFTLGMRLFANKRKKKNFYVLKNSGASVHASQRASIHASQRASIHARLGHGSTWGGRSTLQWSHWA
nr:hypothetical protein [Pandoravirus aubagnensis]